MRRPASIPLCPRTPSGLRRLLWIPLALALLIPLIDAGRPGPRIQVPSKQRAAHFGARMPDRWPSLPYHREILAAAMVSRVDPLLVAAVVTVESGFRPQAVSARGAVGLMQVMPGTAGDYGDWDLADPRQNLEAGSRHLARLLDRFDGDLSLALAAYNAGVANVLRHGGVPPFPETRRYVQRVLRHYQRMAATT